MAKPEKITVCLDRRGFLTGIGIAFSSASLQTFAKTAHEADYARPQRAVFGELPYVSFDGTGETYQAPKGNQSTRDYINSLSREEYLRRHWIT